MRFMKKARAVLAGAALFLSIVFPVHGQVTDLWLEITGVTNNTAFLTIHVPDMAANDVYNLFFTENLETPCTWSRVMRCEPGQTNPVVTDLPPTQGFFMLGSPIRPGFDQQILDRNDDGSSSLVPLPFNINFLSYSESVLYVNNNGNVTFDKSLGIYKPDNLAFAGVKIIAPFWADVDTRIPSPGVVQYGTNVVNGCNAFGVDWVNVGYFNCQADKLLSCQLVIIDRSDIDTGDFDMEFNYYKVQWEWGDVSKNSPPHAGFSNGSYDYELPGSGVEGMFLDTNAVTGLIYNNLNSPVPGRYIFYFRDGEPLGPLP